MHHPSLITDLPSFLPKLPDRPLLLGLSGGADSVALLRALIARGCLVTAVHCNFHLRGAESNRDEVFVSDLCQRLGVELTIHHFDAIQYASQNHFSLEDACRRLRYDLFFRIMEERDFARVAIAHNADDNAETLLLALMRGAGLRGIKAMTYDDGRIIRPLLNIARSEIEAWLDQIGQNFIIDSTNLKNDFKRNYLRNQIIPALEKRWPAARNSFNRSIAALQADFLLLQQFLEPVAQAPVLSYSHVTSSAAPKSLIYHFIRSFGGTTIQAEEMARSCNPIPRFGAHWSTPHGKIIAGRDGFEKIPHFPIKFPQLSGEEVNLTTSSIIEMKQNRNHDELWTTLSPQHFEIRHRREGDKIQSLGMKGHQRVADIIKDARLSHTQANQVVVVEHKQSGCIVWIPGLKRSRQFLIDLKNPPLKAWRIKLRH